MKIDTTGKLRAFLAQTVDDVASGRMDVAKASQVAKLAGKITESFYVEVKTAALQLEMGRQSVPLGELAIGETTDMDHGA